MENISVIYTQGKLKLIFKNYNIEDGEVIVELSAKEADELITYIEMSEDIDKGFL